MIQRQTKTNRMWELKTYKDLAEEYPTIDDAALDTIISYTAAQPEAEVSLLEQLIQDNWVGSVSATQEKIKKDHNIVIPKGVFMRALASFPSLKTYTGYHDTLAKHDSELLSMPSVAMVENFWRRTIADPMVDMAHKLKASELLAKSNGMMVERKAVSAQVQFDIKQLLD